MIIKYLGTGAAEGIPAVFCHCDVCNYARANKGKNIRTRSQAIIDGKILIDFGPDTYLHSLKYDINLADINDCLITHAHEDHFYVEDIRARRRSRANLREGTPPFNVYGGLGVKERLSPRDNGFVTKDNSVLFHKIEAFKTIKINDNYYITPLPAVHKTIEPFVFIIEKNNNKFLYGHDTDYFEENVWSYFIEHNILFDGISLDCTEGKKHIDYPGHMNFERIQKVCDRMKKDKIINEKTIIVANHISHNGLVTYEEAFEIGSSLGYIVAYDGMKIEI